jgi:hypothetical protein
MAEEYFSRLHRAEIGIHRHIAGAYLLQYAQESSWREDNRRTALPLRRERLLGFKIFSRFILRRYRLLP